MITEQDLLENNYVKETESTTQKTYFVKQISDKQGIRYFILVTRYSSVEDKEFHYEGIVEFKLNDNEYFRVEKVEMSTETVQSLERFYDYMFRAMRCKDVQENKILTK